MALKGSCHCKATQFEVNEPPAKLPRATRFVLRQVGAIYVESSQFIRTA